MSTNDELVSKLLESKDFSLSINGSRLSYRGVESKPLAINAIGEGYLAQKSFEYASADKTTQRAMCDAIYKEILIRLNAERKKDKVKEGTIDTLLDIDRLEPVIDVTTGKYALFDPEIRQISQVHFKVWEAKFDGTKNRRDEYLRENASPIKIEFNPPKMEREYIGKLDGQGVTIINSYKHPKWMLEPPKEGEPIVCPPLIFEFLKHLFADQKSLDYALAWLHYAVMSRNETFLILNGIRGVGKNILVDYLIPPLVGEDYYFPASDGFLESQFKSALATSRIIFFDEKRVNNKTVVALKRIINSKQSIERKGIDVDKPIDIYANFILANNEETDLIVKPDERRFSVVHLGKTPLPKAWSKAKIRELIDSIRDYETVRAWGNFIKFGFKPKYNQYDPFKEEKFWELVNVSPTEWQKLIIDKILSKTQDKYEFTALREEYKVMYDKKLSIGYDVVRSFLENHLLQEGKPLGKAVKEDNRIYIVPTKEYLPSKTDITLEDLK